MLFGRHACNPFLGVGIVMVFMLGARSQEHPRLEATRVKMDLDDIIEKTLHLDTIQSKLSHISFTRMDFDPEDYITLLADKLRTRFNDIVAAVTNLKNVIERSYSEQQPGATPPEECCKYKEIKDTYSEDFDKSVSKEQYCMRKAEQAPPDSVYPSEETGEAILHVMVQNDLLGKTGIRWQFFGTTDGIAISFPAAYEEQGCSSYDARVRPWYVGTSTSRHRDMVILVDVSKHHSHLLSENYMGINAARTVLKTLNPNDRVALVMFDRHEHTPPGDGKRIVCFDDFAFVTPLIFEYLNTSLEANFMELAGGHDKESNYLTGIRRAFQFFEDDTANFTDEREKIILLLGDTAASRQSIPDAIYNEIQLRNENVNNEVVIYTYALGPNLSADQEELLSNISQQTLSGDSVKRGNFAHIESLSKVKSELGSYYEYPMRDVNTTYKVHFTVAYYDQWGLGMVISTCQRVYNLTTSEFFGVTCVDTVLNDLLGDIDAFIYGEHSYAFIIDASGRTLIHPWLPKLFTVTEPPIILDIKVLERAKNNSNQIIMDRIISSMKSGCNGTDSLDVTRTYSHGMSMLNGLETKSFHSRYDWRPVTLALDGSRPISVCIVTVANDHHIALNKLQDGSALNPVYHYEKVVEDLPPSEFCCLSPETQAYKEDSVIQLSSQAFVNSDVLDDPFLVHELHDYVKLGKEYPDKFRVNVREYIQHTTFVHTLWKQSSEYDAFVDLRFLSCHGVTRTWPGVSIYADNFNPADRPWDRAAKAQPDKLNILPPYADAVGGIIQTVSKMIYTNGSDSTRVSMCVAAVDMRVGFLRRVLKNYEQCSQQDKRCMLIDRAGYLLYHDNFVKQYNQSLLNLHLIDMEPFLASHFISIHVMEQEFCADFVNVSNVKSWKIKLQEDLPGVTGNLKYDIQEVPGTNSYLIGVEYFNDTRCSCAKSPSSRSTYECVSTLDAMYDCECPCRDSYDAVNKRYDFCRNEFDLTYIDHIQVCIPPPPKLDFSTSPGTSSNCTQKMCKTIQCQLFTDEIECGFFGLDGCSWCQNGNSKGKGCLQLSMCSSKVSGPLDDGTIAAVVLVLIALAAACVILTILYRRGALKKKCWDKNYEEVDHKKKPHIHHPTLRTGPPVPDSNPTRRGSVPNNNGTCTPEEDIPDEHGGAVNPAYLSNGETEAMPTPPPGGESLSPDYTSMNSKQYASNIPRCSTMPDSNRAIYMSNPPIATGGDSGIVDDFGESSTDVPDDPFLKTIIRSNSFPESEQSCSLSSRVRSTSECLQSVAEECIPPPDEFTADLSVSGLDVDLSNSVSCLAHTPYHETLTESPGDDNTTSALSSLQRAAAECLAHTREVSANDDSQGKQYTTIDLDVPREYENPNVDKGITTPWLEHTHNTNVSVENSGSSND